MASHHLTDGPAERVRAGVLFAAIFLWAALSQAPVRVVAEISRG